VGTYSIYLKQEPANQRTSEPGTKELSLDRLLMPWLIADAGSHVLKTAVGIV
jgi:hypothetical protein